MKRGRIVNILLLLFLALLLFTPVGFHLKVLVNRIISFNPTPVEERKQEVLDSFDWQLQNGQGEDFNLREARGEVIFINLWASWCPPCVAEMPDLSSLYNDYKDEVVFLFVARDQKAKAEAFLKKHNYDLPVYYETGLAPNRLESRSLPTTYVVDKNGIIIVAETGAANWNSSYTRQLLDGLINEPFSN